MGNTPTLVDAAHLSNGDSEEANKILLAQQHDLQVDVGGVATPTQVERSEEKKRLDKVWQLGKKKGLLFGWTLDPNGLWDFTNDLFTRNIADSIANPPAQPPKMGDGSDRQVSKFESRDQQWHEIEKAPPIAPSVDSGSARNAIIDAAKGHNIDPNALLTLSYIESRWKSNAYNTSSGASGLFQFVPSTARAMGVSDPFNAQQSSEKGAELWNINREGLAHGLGRDATFGETYLAHQQGVGGAVALLNHRDMSAVDALMTTRAYSGRRWLAEKAVVQNGGDVNMSAGQFADKWVNHYDRVYAQVQVAELRGPDAGPVEAGTHRGGAGYRLLGGGPTPDTSLHSGASLMEKLEDRLKKAAGIHPSPEAPS